MGQICFVCTLRLKRGVIVDFPFQAFSSVECSLTFLRTKSVVVWKGCAKVEKCSMMCVFLFSDRKEELKLLTKYQVTSVSVLFMDFTTVAHLLPSLAFVLQSNWHCCVCSSTYIYILCQKTLLLYQFQCYSDKSYYCAVNLKSLLLCVHSWSTAGTILDCDCGAFMRFKLWEWFVTAISAIHT